MSVTASQPARGGPFCLTCECLSMVGGFCSNKACLEYHIPASCPFDLQRLPGIVVLPPEVNHRSKSVVKHAGYDKVDRGVIRRLVLRGLCMDSFSTLSNQNVLYVKRLGDPHERKRWARIIQLLEGLNHFHHKSTRVADDIAWMRENRWRLVGVGE